MRINLDLTLVLATDGNIFKLIATDPKKAYEVGIKHPAKYVDVVANLSLMQQAANLASADSLLGMEKTKIEAMEYGGVYTIGPFKNEYDYMKANNLTVDEILIAVDINGVTKYVPLPILLQMVVLVISP
jgi:hypothetical protein